MNERRREKNPKVYKSISQKIGNDLGEKYLDLEKELNLSADEMQSLVDSLSIYGHLSVTDVCDGFVQRSKTLQKDIKALEKLQEIDGI